ncbi:acetolactate synthase 2 catalytic subunit [Aeromonas encheleia]|uniref:thiamine pyrophosphate-binding protein n=1 Tax=Aeromonas encheleia TaxID=73010 RepID=UPI0005B1FE8C|nr:thiamine pyrophosphate-binding protein [Aeromonas encheleia]VEG97228.1 acetolactate synthase 2 catalytic subunit [Aeromonas encheleia]
MKASDAVAHVLGANNVTHGFELIGGMIAHLVDSINQIGKTKLISLHHEQAAAFAAGGVARASNNKQIGLALGTSGPGATNLVTGIADCWLDSYPCIFLTGQVNTYELKQDRAIRQQGFQELDIISIVKSITKFSYQIKTKDELIPKLQEAINIAKSGRPGPVLLDIPMDLQRAELPDDVLDYLKQSSPEPSAVTSNTANFSSVFQRLAQAKKPLFLIGGGAVNADNFSLWQQKIARMGIPHVASLKGSEKCQSLQSYYGLIGSYGTRTANYAIQNCDLLVVLGSRMDVRQTGADTNDFARNADIIQIDIDAAQLANRIKADLDVNADCEKFFSCYDDELANGLVMTEGWTSELHKHWSDNYVDEYQDWSMSPFDICKKLEESFKSIPVHYVADVGNNQMWAAHSILLNQGQAIHHSGGLGAMGFAIPTAIGVAYATKDPVVVLTGDGGAQLNIQELDIIARERLPVLTIVFNNESLGMVRAFQEMYFDGRNESTYWNGYSSSFCSLGRAYNILSFSTSNIAEFESLLLRFASHPEPMLIEVLMSDARECRPRLAFGQPIDKQFPLKG